ncbi:MAG TPA: tetratricopeptide repeat protein [Kofleriaceae bacterium]|nr:tetratricopeptide repeat protein [Kofleriaceae bacterium]
MTAKIVEVTVADVPSGYSTRDAAQLAGLTESAVRGCARAGLLSDGAAALPPRFSFQDLAVLKSVKELVAAGVSWRSIRRQLHALRGRIAPEAGLSSLKLAARGRQVVVREGAVAWQADSGQMLLEFGEAGAGGEITALRIRREAPAPEPAVGLTADRWFERGAALEEDEPDAAIEAYKHALHLRPDCTETLINLGRLHAERGAVEQAAEHFARAIELDPRDATAVYNLGVVAQDMGKDDEAVRLYEHALALDPALAEAHYNLATIFDRTGDPRAAIRHIHEYRKLTRD